MNEISKKDIILAKRTAMQLLFWTACPLDDDHGFDRMMKMGALNELINADWGSLFIHQHLCECSINELKHRAMSSAAKLLCNFKNVTQDVAHTLLTNHSTSEPVEGVFTQV